MRRENYFIVIFICLQQCACNQRQEQQNIIDPDTPKVTEVKGYMVPKDSALPPRVTPVGKAKIIKAGKPEIISIVKNSCAVGTPEIIPAGKPRIITPGQNGFTLPGIVPVIDHPLVAGIPEMLVVKDAAIKDNDPENFSSFKVLQGLRHPLIDCMMQDKNGNLWIGTFNGGVSKYDGKFFTNYTSAEGLSYDGIWSILQDKKGNIWMGTCGGGVCKYDGKYFINYSTAEGLANNIVISILEDKQGNLWFGTKGGGVSRYDGKSFTNYTMAQGLANDNVHSIAEDNNGNIWLGTLGGGVSKFNGKSFSNYTTGEGLPDNNVNSIFKDRTGDLWFGTNGGISKYNGQYFINYTTKQGITNDYVNCIFEDRSGDFWFGTEGGITEYDGKTFVHHTVVNGLSNDKVTCIVEDKAGTLWFGTKGGGVSRFDGRYFTHFTAAQGLCNDEIMRIVEDNKGNLWFGSWGGGVSKYDGRSFSNYNTNSGLCDNTVYSILQDKKGNFWFGTKHGLSKYDGEYFTNYDASNGFTDAQIWSIVEDNDANIWFGTFGEGVIKYDGKYFTHYSVAQGLSNVFVMSIVEDEKNNLWFGIYGGGVCKYDGKSFTRFTTAQGLNTNEVMPMMEDKSGNFWFGTIGKGVNKYDGKYFTNYSTPQGLSNSIVMGVMQDKAGNIWISTRNGLNRLVRPVNSAITSASEKNKRDKGLYFKSYSFAEGFLGVNCYLSSILEDSKGLIWIGTSDRLTCYNPKGEIPDTVSPNIQLNNIALFNEYVDWSNLEKKKDTTLILNNEVHVANFKFDSLSKWYSLPGNLSLSYNNNYLTFKFIGITTKNPDKVKYKYKLDGLEKNWNAVTDRNEAPYGNLPNGMYTFRVKAMNSEGYWSDELNYSFTITPPWWKTIWFRLLELVFTLLALYGIYRYRLNQVLRFQAIRNKIAHDLHDDIGSTLNSISIYSEVAKQDPSKHSDALEMIGESSRKIIDTMSDIVWAISPENDSFENIILRMRSLAYNLLRAKNIEFIFRADESLNNIKLTMENRRNFFLIFKEAINNLVKYADASKVSIQLSHESSLIKLIIRDDGKGFDITQPPTGNGLTSMKRRAGEMKAQLQIESGIGEGTSIELILKS